jgi:thioesterase domain-containing protein/aryl carrier-like protein
LYTSGSSGVAKGVVVEQGALINYLNWAVDTYEAERGCGAPVNTSLAFDATMTSLLLPLVAGRAVFLLPDDDRITRLAALLGDDGDYTLVKLTPAHVQALAAVFDRGRGSVGARRFVVGGEALHASDVRAWQELDPRLAIVNEYGPTEATVGCVIYTTDRESMCSDGAVAIGRPTPNTTVYLVDQQLRHVPAGVVGEVFIAGSQLARGYLKAPGATAERFVANPYGPPGSRIYRTGDLARWRFDGQLEFVGRNDTQVKVRGFRVELGEIESILRGIPDVRDAAVTADGDRLAAHVIAAAPGSTTEIVRRVKTRLRDMLPEYMVPSLINVLDAWPLTPNGKIDRRALLPARQEWQGVRRRQTPAEQILCRTVGELLGRTGVCAGDNFFELGGDSLRLYKLVARARDAGLIFNARDVFAHPTLESLAATARRSLPGFLPSRDVVTNPFDRIIPLRSHGRLAPLFCVPPGGGLGWMYARLLVSLNEDRPVFALQVPGIGEDAPFPPTLSGFADDFLATMRTVAAAGPYHLIGLCSGGLVAHDMACKLREQSEPVGLVGIVDVYPDVLVHQPEIGDVAAYTQFLREHIHAPSLADAEYDRVIQLNVHIASIRGQFRPQIFDGDLVVFAAAECAERVAQWAPYARGSVTSHVLPCSRQEVGGAAIMPTIGELIEQHLAANVVQSLDAPLEAAAFPKE